MSGWIPLIPWIPLEIVKEIMGYVGEKKVVRLIFKKGAREWYPVSKGCEEESRRKRVMRSKKRNFKKRRKQLERDWGEALESSDPWSACEEWKEVNKSLENEHTEFIKTFCLKF
jgi:hypothetical protein